MPAKANFYNNNNSLCISADERSFRYASVMTFQSTTPSPTTFIPTASFTTHTAGYSTYTWDGQFYGNPSSIIVGVIRNSQVAETSFDSWRIRSIEKSGTVWTVTFQCGNGSSPNSAGYLTERSTTLYVFYTMTSLSTFGLIGYDEYNGTPKFDLLNRSNDWMCAGYYSFSQDVLSSSLQLNGPFSTSAGVKFPIIIGSCAGTQQVQSADTSTQGRRWQYYYRYYSNNGVLYRTPILEKSSSPGFILTDIPTVIPRCVPLAADGFRLVVQ